MVEKIVYSRQPDYRKQALEAARDFNYGEEVISKIKNAKTEDEISGIMKAARKEAIKRDHERGRR